VMVVKARDRFTLLGDGFYNRSMKGLLEPSNYSDRWTVYVCPACRTQTGFKWADFYKHAGIRFSNLSPADQEAVEREVADWLTDGNSFLDFYCSGCKGVVRVYYQHEPPEERVHGGRVELKTVVERMLPRNQTAFIFAKDANGN
jgi:hypothetical protein